MNDDRVISFLDDLKNTADKREKENAFMNSPDVKKSILKKNAEECKDKCLNYLIAGVYKNSLPLDEDYIKCNEIDIDNNMKDMVNNEVENKGLTCFITDAVKNGNMSLKELKEAVDNMVDTEYKIKSSDINNTDIKDLDYKFDSDRKSMLDQIAKDTSINDISKIIKKNVVDSIEYERDKIRERKEEDKKLEEELANDPAITSESALNRALAIRRYTKQEVYKPGLFEAILTKKSKSTSNMSKAYTEAVKEYTFVNMCKALKIKNYNQDLINKYIKSCYKS